MNIPVLIAARNESENIAQALLWLPRNVEPIVIANGCTDNTAAIADGLGATVIVNERAGKLPALQEGMKFLGRRAVEEAFMTLDADSRPVFRKHWSTAMHQAVTAKSGPSLAVGPLWFRQGPGAFSNVIRSTKNYIYQFTRRNMAEDGWWPGANMVIKAASSRVLDAMIELDHFWPGEDEALRDVILQHGGTSHKTMHPHATIFTNARRHTPISHTVLLGRGYARASNGTSYVTDAAIGSQPYSKQIGI